MDAYPPVRVVGLDELMRILERIPRKKRRAYPPLEKMGYLSVWDGKAFVFAISEATEVFRKLDWERLRR